MLVARGRRSARRRGRRTRRRCRERTVMPSARNCRRSSTLLTTLPLCAPTRSPSESRCGWALTCDGVAEGRPAQLRDAATAAHLARSRGAPRPSSTLPTSLRRSIAACVAEGRRPDRVVAAVGQATTGIDQQLAERALGADDDAEDPAHVRVPPSAWERGVDPATGRPELPGRGRTRERRSSTPASTEPPRPPVRIERPLSQRDAVQGGDSTVLVPPRQKGRSGPPWPPSRCPQAAPRPEWCADTYHASYVGAPADGRAWTTESPHAPRMLRGGSWSSGGAAQCRSAERIRALPTDRLSTFGFRVVVEGK